MKKIILALLFFTSLAFAQGPTYWQAKTYWKNNPIITTPGFLYVSNTVTGAIGITTIAGVTGGPFLPLTAGASNPLSDDLYIDPFKKIRNISGTDYILFGSGQQLHYSSTPGYSSQVVLNAVGGTIESVVTNLSNSEQTSIITTETDIKIRGDQSGFQGLTYDQDYSANYSFRSLVDYGYLTGRLSTVGGAAFTSITGLGTTVLGSGTLSQTIIGQSLQAGTGITINGNTISASGTNTSVTGSGAATVTGTSTFNVNVSIPSITGVGLITSSGPYPSFTIDGSALNTASWSITGNVLTSSGVIGSKSGDFPVTLQTKANSLLFNTNGVQAGSINSTSGWNIGGSGNIGLGNLHEINGSITGLSVFTLTSGVTAVNSSIITYASNTVVKPGDRVSGVTIRASSYIVSVLGATSSMINTTATGTSSVGVNFTITPQNTPLAIQNYVVGASGLPSIGASLSSVIVGTGAAKDNIGLDLKTFILSSNISDVNIGIDMSRMSAIGSNTYHSQFKINALNGFKIIGDATGAFLSPIIAYSNGQSGSQTLFGYHGSTINTTITNNYASFGNNFSQTLVSIPARTYVFGNGAFSSSSYTGTDNIGIGLNPGMSITSGSNNFLMGANQPGNSITTGSRNILISANTTANTSDVIAIGIASSGTCVNHSNSILLSSGESYGATSSFTEFGTTGPNQVMVGGFANTTCFFFGGNTYMSGIMSNYQKPIQYNNGLLNSSISVNPNAFFISGIGGAAIFANATSVSIGDVISGTNIPGTGTITATGISGTLTNVTWTGTGQTTITCATTSLLGVGSQIQTGIGLTTLYVINILSGTQFQVSGAGTTTASPSGSYTFSAFVSFVGTTSGANSGTYTITKHNISGQARSIITRYAQATGSATGGDGVFQTAVSTTTGTVPQSYQDVLRITATQRVGIGNLGQGNVLEALHVSGNIRGNHIIGNTSTPGIAAGAGAGTGATVSIVGNDLSGRIIVTTGTLPTLSATIATITFANTFGAIPGCIQIQAYDDNAAGLMGSVNNVFAPGSSTTTSTFIIRQNTVVAVSAPAPLTTYTWTYIVLQ